MVTAAVAVVAGVRHVDDAVHKSERSAVFLDQRCKKDAVIHGGGVHIHRPASIGGAGVHIQRVNEMLLSHAIDQCVEEK